MRAKLKMSYLARRPVAAFGVKRCSRAIGRPDSLALPARFRIIDPAVHPLGIKPHRIRHAQDDKLATLGQKRKQRVISIAGGNRHILPESKGIELIHPIIVAGLGASWIGDTLQLRSRQWIKRPSFGAVPPCRCRPVEWPLTLASVESREVSAGDHCPHYAVAINIQSARRESVNGRAWIVPGQFVHLCQSRPRWIRSRV